MSQKHSPTYTIVFVTIISLVCALLLSITASSLKKRIDANRELEINKNILIALKVFGTGGLPEDAKEAKKPEVDAFIAARIEFKALDISGKDMELETALIPKLKPWKQDPDAMRLPVFCLKGESSGYEAYAVPIWGKGLWGQMLGYLSIQADGKTVRGVTFFKHIETPGLGAKVDTAEFQDQWIGKTIFDESGKLTPIVVAKGAAQVFTKADPDLMMYHIDGMSGATKTGEGVSDMIKTTLAKYEPFLRKLQKGGAK
ncbi:NADH:ubiquinone reductase (Na(+)-transporting) subunit C [bacterium M21]|nr:NADH:ubiquinone reductase (Na(+)-transporting) subunit C [bacterium M21]